MEAYLLTYAADESGPVVIPDRLPPLVSFELDQMDWCDVYLKLPSLCTQVAASLKNLSLPSMKLNSSDLQYIGDHLPLLEVLECWCVLYIAFKIITIIYRLLYAVIAIVMNRVVPHLTRSDTPTLLELCRARSGTPTVMTSWASSPIRPHNPASSIFIACAICRPILSIMG